MKRYLLTALTAILGFTLNIKAQNPDVIYIASWDGMTANYGSHGVGTPVTPDTNDPKLSFNSESNCYEGEIYDWAKSSGTTAWNAKIPYSFDGDVVTYYSGTTYPNINFSTNPSQTFTFEISEDPSSLKGYNLAAMNKLDVCAAKVSLDLVNKTITFTEIDNVSEAPQLLAVDPENGSVISPQADGSVDITLTFSAQVSSMRVLVEGSELTPVANEDGTVWTISIPASLVESSVSESNGLFKVLIDQVFAKNTPVTFDGDTALVLSYPVEGVTLFATINLAGDTEYLDVFKSPNYTLGDELKIEGNTFSVSFTSSVTYFFTAPVGYTITVDSNADIADWSIGTAWSKKVTVNPDTEQVIEENYLEGTTLTIRSGAAGYAFNVVVSDSTAIDTISREAGSDEIFNLNGVRVDLNHLTPGIYVVNGKKVLIK